MTEAELVAGIDCRFPFDDRARAAQLVAAAATISANAAFSVAHELARQRGPVPTELRLELLSELDAAFEHPEKALILGITRRMIVGERLDEREALAAMRALAAHRDQWQALNIAYFSTGDGSPELDREWDRISAGWTREA